MTRSSSRSSLYEIRNDSPCKGCFGLGGVRELGPVFLLALGMALAAGDVEEVQAASASSTFWFDGEPVLTSPIGSQKSDNNNPQ
jgi:hypothetical protein